MSAAPFIDLHLHAEGIRSEDLGTLVQFGLQAAVTCALDPPGGAEEIRRHWDDLVGPQADRLQRAGLRPLVALGVHPARIPWQGVEALLSRLPRYFDDPRVVALGEVGLSEGTAREEEVLLRQLELSRALRRPAILHTPAQQKLSRTRRLLSLVREAKVSPDRVLVDHVTAETLPLVRACGFWAGLTLQPGLLSAEEAARLVSRHGASQLVLTSDFGDGPGDLLALPRAADALHALGLSGELIGRLLVDGPLAFLGLGREGVRGRRVC